MSNKLSNSSGIIILGGHVQALGILRILGRHGIAGIIIDETHKNLAKKSKFCHKSFTIKTGDLLSFLLKLGNEEKYKGWVIFPTNDFHVKMLSINKEILAPFFITGVDNWDSVNVFYNKRNTYELAKRLTIPIAKTFYPDSITDLVKTDVAFPCIIKPAVMYDFYKQAKQKVFVCKTLVELEENYKKALQLIPANEIIIQEIIPGPSKNQFSAAMLFLNGETIVSLTACRMRQHPIDFGNATTYAETVENPLLIKFAESILKEAKYNGICEVEFKLDEVDGQYKFLEVNTRTWKWHSIANKANTPFLKTYFDYLTGNKIFPTKGFTPAAFRHPLTDIVVQVNLFMKGFNYAFRKRKPVENAVWSKDDPMPWLFERLYLIHLIKTR